MDNFLNFLILHTLEEIWNNIVHYLFINYKVHAVVFCAYVKMFDCVA